MPAVFKLTCTLTALPNDLKPYFVHAAIHDLITEVDKKAGDYVHSASTKPIALDYDLKPRQLICNLRVLDESLCTLLSKKLKPGSSFGFNQPLAGVLSGVDVREESYRVLHSRATLNDPPTKIRLSFDSPTAVSEGTMHWPLPIARYVWRGLHRRWQTYYASGGDEDLALPANFDDWLSDHVRCEHYSNANKAPSSMIIGKSGSGRFLGYEGCATYVVKKGADTENRKYTAILASFAEYSGVGVNVAYGCGVVKTTLS